MKLYYIQSVNKNPRYDFSFGFTKCQHHGKCGIVKLWKVLNKWEH